MGGRDRADGRLLIVLVAAVALPILGLWLWLTTPSIRTWIVTGVLYVPLTLIAVLAWWPRSSERLNDLRGAATITLVVGAVAVAIVAVLRTGDQPLWLWFVVVVTAVAVVLVLVALEWSRVALHLTALVLGVLVVTLVVDIGYTAERRDSVDDPVAEATSEVGRLHKDAVADAVEADEKSLAAFGAALTELERSLRDAPEEFRTAGSRAWEELRRATQYQPDPTSLTAAMAELLALDVREVQTVQSIPVRDAAIKAVAARPKERTHVPSRDDVDEAITAVRCAGDPPQPEGCAASTPLDVALHELRIELARYRSAVNPGDEALAAAVATLSGEEPEPVEVSFWQAIGAGPPAIIESITQPSPVGLVPGPIGWALLGAAAAWGLRRLSRLNALQMPGPVAVEFSGDDAQLKAALRMAVLKNLKTPAAAPGAEAAKSVTDLTDAAGATPKSLGAAVAAIAHFVSPPPGYLVEAEVLDPPKATTSSTSAGSSAPPASGGPTRVMVRISASGSKESLASKVVEHEDARIAVKTAGFWAAGFLLRRSSRIPTWASWDEATSGALGAATADAPTLDELEEAVRCAPRSGWVLLLYGHELELAGRQLDAIGAYARAVAVHPRYLTARYRLAVAIGMSAHDVSKVWTTPPYAERAPVLEWLRHSGVRLGVHASEEYSITTGTPITAERLKALACAILGTVVADSRWPRTWAGSLRRSERSMDWLGWWHGTRRSHRSTMWLARSAQLNLGQDSQSFVRKVKRHADRPSSSWQVGYNHACYLARPENPSIDAALGRLETCLLRPGVEQLTQEWVSTDPDLKALRTSPRFEAFQRRLAKGARS